MVADQEVWQHYWQVEIPTQRWLLALAELVIVLVVEREAGPTHWRRLASRRLDSGVAVGDPCCTVMCQMWMSSVQSHLLDWSWSRARYLFPPVIAARGTGLGQSPEMHLCGWWAGQEQQDGGQRNLRDLQRDCSDPRQHRRSLSGGDLGRRWGRLAAAWPARLSKGLVLHLVPLAAVEVVVAVDLQSAKDPKESAVGPMMESPGPPHHLRDGRLDQGLREVGGLHQTEAGGMELVAVVVVVALPVGVADVAGREVADVAAASSSAEREAAAASTSLPPLFSSSPPLPLSSSCLPPHLYCPGEEEQDQE